MLVVSERITRADTSIGHEEHGGQGQKPKEKQARPSFRVATVANQMTLQIYTCKVKPMRLGQVREEKPVNGKT